jgi:tellurite resistance protein
LYESRFFDWVVTTALNGLVRDGYLEVFDRQNTLELERMGNKIGRMKFYANADAVRTDRERQLMKRHVVSTARLVSRYSDANSTRMLGAHLESLVKSQLQISQFEIMGVHTNEHLGRKWTKTNHNLDFIAKKKGNGLAIGVEVKNTLGGMDPEEIDVKIDICRYLGIVPVFAVRWNKQYINCVHKQGGFSWFFKTQMFPLGQESLVNKLFTRLSAGQQLKFPVSVRTSLPEKTVRVFDRWVRRVEDNPPYIDVAVRCGRTQAA